MRCGVALARWGLDTIARGGFRGTPGLLLLLRRTPIRFFPYVLLLFSVFFSMGLLVVWIDVIFFGL